MDLIKHIKDQNKTIIFSTHQLGEVKDIADKIIVMESGEKIFDGDKDMFQKIKIIWNIWSIIYNIDNNLL